MSSPREQRWCCPQKSVPENCSSTSTNVFFFLKRPPHIPRSIFLFLFFLLLLLLLPLLTSNMLNNAIYFCYMKLNYWFSLNSEELRNRTSSKLNGDAELPTDVFISADFLFSVHTFKDFKMMMNGLYCILAWLIREMGGWVTEGFDGIMLSYTSRPDFYLWPAGENQTHTPPLSLSFIINTDKTFVLLWLNKLMSCLFP